MHDSILGSELWGIVSTIKAEIVRRVGQASSDWRAKAIMLERDGLSRIDPVMGGRFWPAVESFVLRRYYLALRASSCSRRKSRHRD